MKNTIRIAIAFLCILCLAACGLTVESVMSVIAPEETPAPGSDLVFSGEQAEEVVEPLHGTYKELDGIFCPFFAQTDGDRQVSELTQLSIASTDGSRSPAEITRASKDDGSTEVQIRLRDDLVCSDGTALTADDLLFTLYVLLDADYDGSYTLKTLPIRGLSGYWNGMDPNMYSKYITIYDETYSGGNYDKELQKALEIAQETALNNGIREEYLANDEMVAAAQKALDEYETEKAEEIRAVIEEYWKKDAEQLVKYTMDNYAATISIRTPFTTEEVRANAGLQVMYSMLDRGFGTLDNAGVFTSTSGKTWDLTTTFPTTDDFYTELNVAYNGDAEQYWSIEGFGRASMLDAAENALVLRWAEQDEEWQGTINTIEGLAKTDNYTVTITLDYCDDAIFKTLTDIPVVPLHIYGNKSLFTPAGYTFGFTRGDLSAVRAQRETAVGAGEFVYVETDVRTVRLEANPHYWLGISRAPAAELTRE